MKKLICLLLFASSMGYAQDVSVLENEPSPVYTSAPTPIVERLLKNEDFKLSEGRMQVSEKKCLIDNNANSNNILISVVCQQKAFKEIGVERINEMIRFANGKVSNSVLVTEKYKPTEIRMAYNPESKDWSLTNLFTLEDENGKTKTKLLALDFDSKGSFVVMKRIF